MEREYKRRIACDLTRSMPYIGAVQVKLQSLSSPLHSVSIYQRTESLADMSLDMTHVLLEHAHTFPKNTLINLSKRRLRIFFTRFMVASKVQKSLNGLLKMKAM